MSTFSRALLILAASVFPAVVSTAAGESKETVVKTCDWCEITTPAAVHAGCNAPIEVSVHGAPVGAQTASAPISIGLMRCEYAVNPVGIDTRSPRLGWVLEAAGRARTQSAFQIQAARSIGDLQGGKDLLWDSGKVRSDRSQSVPYQGAPLVSGDSVSWRVRAWDEKDQPTDWSQPAFFTLAKLDAADWKAGWIGRPELEGPPLWEDYTLALDLETDSGGGILFRARDEGTFYCWDLSLSHPGGPQLEPKIVRAGREIALPPVKLERESAGSGRHRLEIEVRGPRILTRWDGRQVDERSDEAMKAGTIGFRAMGSGKLVIHAVEVTGKDGKTLLRESFGLPDKAFPRGLVVNGALEVQEAGHCPRVLLHRPALPEDCARLRKEFTLPDKPVRRATASVCGLGFNELYLNGKKSDSRVLASANTPYDKRLIFDTMEVGELLRPGANAVGLWLAPGYAEDTSKWGWRWTKSQRALLQLDIEFEDGTRQSVVSDGSWKLGTSPLTVAHLYHGEEFDARLENRGWALPGFEARGWGPVTVLSAPGVALEPNPAPPIRVMREIRPVAVTEPRPGVFVFDMGQNFAGWVRVSAEGPTGTRIALRHAELVRQDGVIDPETNRNARNTDVWILAGTGPESYEPRFTYHGFRYVEITGFPGRPSLEDVTGCVVHADLPETGSFTSSDKDLNRLWNNARWSLRSNYMSIITDCPMRDERTPCLMDCQASEAAGLRNFWMHGYFRKWLGDIRDGTGNPDWFGNLVSLPWRHYWEYGDRRVLEENYFSMKRVADFWAAQSPERIWASGFGDWLAPNIGTWESFHNDKEVVNTALFAHLTRIVGETAELLGHTADAGNYARTAREVGDSLNKKLYNAAEAIYGDGSQTTSILPLAFGLVPPEHRAAVTRQLLATIRGKDKERLNTGLFGTRFLLDVLCDEGEENLGLHMLLQPEYPGFGFMLARGATTLWEQWRFKGGMNSQNHHALAGVTSSFYSRLAGIRPLEPGYRRIEIRPVLPTALSFVEASQETVMGTVKVRWERRDDIVQLRVTIPANCTARVALPTGKHDAITESGRPLENAEGVASAEFENGRTALDIGSGTYEFAFAATPQAR